MLVAAALALALAMSGVVWGRRPRLMTLKLSGFSDGEVWRTLVFESAIVLGVGCSIGAAFGLLGQFMLTRWLSATTGFPTVYAPAGWLALVTFAGVTAVAVGVAALPGLAAARVARRRLPRPSNDRWMKRLRRPAWARRARVHTLERCRTSPPPIGGVVSASWQAPRT